MPNENEQLAAKALIAEISKILADLPNPVIHGYSIQRYNALKQTDRRAVIQLNDGSIITLFLEAKDPKEASCL